MNKKSFLGLLLFAFLVTAGMLGGANYLTRLESSGDGGVARVQELESDDAGDEEGRSLSGNSGEQLILADEAGETEDSITASGNQREPEDADAAEDNADIPGAAGDAVREEADEAGDTAAGGEENREFWLASNPTDHGEDAETGQSAGATFSTSVGTAEAPQLIRNSNEIDYMAFIPEMTVDNELKSALDISNPDISVDASAAVLFDAVTGKVLYYKNAVQAVFPASTAKLLTALVALDCCGLEEEAVIGEEITMIPSDSTIAYLKQGQVLSIYNLLNGMLLPSGNDAAYAIAAYVGRKSLKNTLASKEEAIAEFVRLMNRKAEELGVKNSCFKTPDGYDAIGQYTTAYDMGLIGMAASENETIVKVSSQGSSRNLFPSGEDVTWKNTNKLVRKGYEWYYSKAIGLKTGTSTMAGKCLVAAAEKDGRKVVCAVMNSSSNGRWKDTLTLLKYGLK
ncbi:D-alanyl-D-alanine carboxypeptidase (penicillin-binding protein 5/6) [Anaerotaenia torta]|uniref:D-alanyl-D-alanine carboxypeptidase family protein n=1 Tax=Anaerotaenia torta TaxID=433293 RepID=UPI003D1D6C25